MKAMQLVGLWDAAVSLAVLAVFSTLSFAVRETSHNYSNEDRP